MLFPGLEVINMLSTVLSIGGIVALIGGVAYFTFQYMPYVIDFWNQVQSGK